MRLTDEQAMALIRWAEAAMIPRAADDDEANIRYREIRLGALAVAHDLRATAKRCHRCSDVLGAKYRQAVPGMGDLCIPCWEKWAGEQ